MFFPSPTLKKIFLLGLIFSPIIGIHFPTPGGIGKVHICAFDGWVWSIALYIFIKSPESFYSKSQRDFIFFLSSIFSCIACSIALSYCLPHIMNTSLWIKDVLKISLFSSNIFLLMGILKYTQAQPSDFLLPGFFFSLLCAILGSCVYTSYVQAFLFQDQASRLTVMGLILTTLIWISCCGSNNLPLSNSILTRYRLLCGICLFGLFRLFRYLFFVSGLFSFYLINLNGIYKKKYIANYTMLILLFIFVFIMFYLCINVDVFLFSFHTRLSIWCETWHTILMSFPKGIGIGQFPVYAYGKTSMFQQLYCHNQFLTFIVEMGIIGCTMVIVFIYFPLKILWKLPVQLRLSAVFLVYSSLLTHEAIGNRAFQFFLAWCFYWAYYHHIQEKIRA